MLTDQDRSWKALAQAVEVAIARGDLEPQARRWGKVVLLEAMAGLLRVAPTKLRNQYYRGDPKLELALLDYTMTSAEGAIESLRQLEFRRFTPLVWKRPLHQLRASRNSLPHTLALVRIAERHMRADLDPPVELRREVGTVAAEIMACALTFFDGQRRWELLSEADRIFRNAMGPLTLESTIEPTDAALFARFWENRATRCGLEWSNIWDDPTTPPTIDMDTASLAIDELERASEWMKRHWAPASRGDGDERIRQFAGDKAKWLAKAGEFDAAREQIDRLRDFAAGETDALLISAFEEITSNSLDAALRTASDLADRLGTSQDSIAPVTAAIMVHNIELMRDKRPPLSEEITQFLREGPVAASEHVNLPRYRRRLRELGYAEVDG